jgi:signal transduction histidine kinase/CheY-like chemotaxis protein
VTLLAGFVMLLGLGGAWLCRGELKQTRWVMNSYAGVFFAMLAFMLLGGMHPALPALLLVGFLPICFVVSGTTVTGLLVVGYMFLAALEFGATLAGFTGLGWFGGRSAGLLVATYFSMVTLLQAMNGCVRISEEFLRLQKKEKTQRETTEAERDAVLAKLRAFARISNGWVWETGPDHKLTRLIKADQLVDGIPGTGQRAMAEPDATDVGPAFLSRLENLPELRRRIEQDFVQQLGKQKPFQGVQIQSRSAEGIPLWFRVSGEPIFDSAGRFQGYLGSAINITRERHREEAMGRALIKASEAQKAKAAFLANASHELRTPLNGIYGMTQVLRTPGMDARQRSYLDAIADSAKRLENTVDLILSVATGVADHGPEEHRPFNVRELLGTVMAIAGDTVRRPALQVKREIDGSVPEVLVGNSRLLSTALVQLLNNAMKFTPAGEVVLRVRAEPSPLPGSVILYMAVADTGIGIAESDLDKLFVPLVQLDQSFQRAYEGLGLGLTAARQAVERLNGSLGVESQPGKGSTFYITLEMDTVEPATATTGAQAEPGFSSPSGQGPVGAPQEKWNILIAEDNPINATYLAAILERAGHRTCTAANGVEALGYVRIERFDAILMDMQMPIMDGVQAARAIRSYEASSGHGRHTPIIAVTANKSEESRKTCLDAGMEDYLPKPVEPNDLFAALRRLIVAQRSA